MFPANLDTKEGQAAAIKATMDMAAASVCLHDAARYIAMAYSLQLATGETAGHWTINSAVDALCRAISAIGYRMVPVDQPTPEEARRLALEEAALNCEAEADRCDDAARWGGSKAYVARCNAAAYAQRDAAHRIRALMKEPSK